MQGSSFIARFLFALTLVTGTVISIPEVAQAQALLAKKSEAAAIKLRHAGWIRSISIDEIEALPRTEISGRVSPDEPLMTCQGALLSDVVEQIGAGKSDRVIVRASDGYAADIPRKDWETWPVVVATRCGGQRLSVRQRGPARIFYPVHQDPDLAARTYVDRSIWLIAEIEW